MVGLDTNILVRFVTRDDEPQWKLVDAFLKENCSSKNPGWISCIVLCEMVWVLSAGYEYSKTDIVHLLQQLILTAEIKIEAHDEIRKTLKEFESGKADFSDYLIGYLNKEQGCELTITLDKKAASHSSLKLLV
jgi:predicted nucleic-acid-binding protein